MAKFKELKEHKGAYEFFCPGCNLTHFITSEVGFFPIKWDFNNDLNSPTVFPSVLVRTPFPEKELVCHSFIKDGNIQFLSDCTHNLAGQTVELPDID